MGYKWEVYFWEYFNEINCKYVIYYRGDSFISAMLAVLKLKMKKLHKCIKIEYRPHYKRTKES